MANVYDYIEEQKKRLEVMVAKGSIKDPALFWAGLMSTWATMTHKGTVAALSYNFQVLMAVVDEYDRAIMSKVEEPDR